MTRIHAHNPQIEIEFYTAKYGNFKVRSPQRYLSTRNMTEPTANARIMMRDVVVKIEGTHEANGKLWKDVVSTKDLCKVSMMGRDNRRHTDIVGVVQKTEIVEIEMNGEPEFFAEISIQDVAGELSHYRIFWHPHVAGRSNIGGIGFFARSNGKIAKGKPNEVVESLYKTFMNDDYNPTLADAFGIDAHLEFRATPSILSEGTTALSALGMEGALWETMSRYADKPWHELFCDVQHERELVQGPPTRQEWRASEVHLPQFDKVGIYHRPTPFDFNSWEKLSQTEGWGFTFDDRERMDDGYELSRDASRVYSFFFCPGKGVYTAFDQLSSAYDASGGILPIYDEDLLRRFGFREMTQGTEYIQFTQKNDATTGKVQNSTFSKWEALALRTLYLYQWFGYTEFYDGVFSTMGRIGPDPETGVRIGSVLRERNTNWQYYVTGVQQVYNFPGAHTTRITVERGRDHEHYKAWWREKISGRYNSTLSTQLPQWLLVKMGLWDARHNLKVPVGNVPVLPTGVA